MGGEERWGGAAWWQVERELRPEGVPAGVGETETMLPPDRGAASSPAAPLLEEGEREETEEGGGREKRRRRRETVGQRKVLETVVQDEPRGGTLEGKTIVSG